MDTPNIERYEKRGFFLTIPFEGEENPTVLYVADRDFENLKELLDSEDHDWTDLRDEIQELLDHSGHEGEHEFTESLVRAIADTLRAEDLPEETNIDDPLEDLPQDVDVE